MHVRLEPQAEHHAAGLFKALQPREIYQFLDGEPPVSVEAVQQRIVRQNNGPQDGSRTRWLNWVVFVDNTVAGYTQATVDADGTANLAYVFSPLFWGKSVAYQACHLTIAELGESGLAHRLIADTEINNIRSRRLLIRLGFELITETKTDALFERSMDG